jgi:adenylate kinase family enzyme
MNLEAILLLGPTGSGKTPLGDHLELAPLWNRRCHHFDFGANLRAVVAGDEAGSFTTEEVRFLRRVLKEGVLLEAEHFPLAVRILDAFIARKGVRAADLLVLNGLPRHIEQAKAMERKVVVIGVVQLDCDAHTVAERLRRNTGGDRTQRADDVEALVARKLAIYEDRTRPLLDHYRSLDVRILKIPVDIKTQPAEMAGLLATLLPPVESLRSGKINRRKPR